MRSFLHFQCPPSNFALSKKWERMKENVSKKEREWKRVSLKKKENESVLESESRLRLLHFYRFHWHHFQWKCQQFSNYFNKSYSAFISFLVFEFFDIMNWDLYITLSGSWSNSPSFLAPIYTPVIKPIMWRDLIHEIRNWIRIRIHSLVQRGE